MAYQPVQRQGRLMDGVLCLIIYGGIAFILLIVWRVIDGDRRFER